MNLISGYSSSDQSSQSDLHNSAQLKEVALGKRPRNNSPD